DWRARNAALGASAANHGMHDGLVQSQVSRHRLREKHSRCISPYVFNTGLLPGAPVPLHTPVSVFGRKIGNINLCWGPGRAGGGDSMSGPEPITVPHTGTQYAQPLTSM
ncbi:MAG: hypothetical protein WA754_27095, partial [Pseudolabrys sp.]